MITDTTSVTLPMTEDKPEDACTTNLGNPIDDCPIIPPQVVTVTVALSTRKKMREISVPISDAAYEVLQRPVCPDSNRCPSRQDEEGYEMTSESEALAMRAKLELATQHVENAVKSTEKRICRDLASRVKWLRHRHGWTQDHLADLMNTTQSVVSHIESGRGGLTVNTLARLALAFGEDLTVRIGDEENEPRQKAMQEFKENVGRAADSLSMDCTIFQDIEARQEP